MFDQLTATTLQLRDPYRQLQEYDGAIGKAPFAAKPAPAVTFTVLRAGNAVEASQELGTRPTKGAENAVGSFWAHGNFVARTVRYGNRHTFRLTQKYGVCHTIFHH